MAEPALGGPILDAEAISFAYQGRFPALSEVSVAVAEAESVAILGANGSGKSTLLKILAGLLQPDAGSLTAFGEPSDAASLVHPVANARFRSRLGFVFQRAEAQLFSATVRAELWFGCRQLGLPADVCEQRIADLSGMLELTDLLDRSPNQLSGGQQRRVAIASVLVMAPSVLLFDEPTAALDPRTTSWLLGLLDQLHAAGRVLVFATHDLELAATTDRCLVLGEDHRVAALGPSAEVLSDRRLLAEVNLIAPS